MIEIIDSIFKWRSGVGGKKEEKEVNRISPHPYSETVAKSFRNTLAFPHTPTLRNC